MAMNCKLCGVSVHEVPLQRVNEKGVEGIWWCEPCLKNNEPELYNNIMEEETQVEKDLKEICYPKKPNN